MPLLGKGAGLTLSSFVRVKSNMVSSAVLKDQMLRAAGS
jgi:hypothetical protein